jgi:hypothetical protein
VVVVFPTDLIAPPLPSQLELEPDLYHNVSLYLLNIIQNRGNLTRIYTSDQVWGSDFAQLSPLSVYTVGSDQSFPNLTMTIISDAFDMLSLFADHLEYFLANTTMRWFIRTTEDAFVHLKRLPVMLRDLESRFDPLTDFVFKGQSIGLNPEILYVHGGSGWIMSRFACEFYRDHRTYIHSTLPTLQSGDDVMPSILCSLRHINWTAMEDIRWAGSPLDDEAHQRLVDRNYSNLPICPTAKFQESQGRPGRALKDLVVWHSGRKEMMTVLAGYRVTAEVPRDVMLVHVDLATTLCRSDPAQAAAWDEWWRGR